jgi:hypothetical protein
MRKFLAILFVLVLISPAAAWILGLDFGININRLGLKFPLPYGRAFLDKDYYRALDHYFNDSFSLRGPLIWVKNWIDLNLFRTTDTNDVHIGRHGWLYSRKSVSDYQPADSEKDADMERLVLQLHAIEKIVTASGRRFVFVVAPSKALVYPEYLGLAAGFINNGPSQYDLLLERLERHPLKSFIRLDDIIKAAKRSQALLYDRQYAHWNGLGASVAAENIYHRIHGNIAGPGVLNYISTHDHQIGDLGAKLMGLTPEFVEKPFRRLAGSVRSDLLSGILYGDLFRHNLTPYLLQMFNRLDIVQADRIPSVQHREDWLGYECIMLEVAQTGLRALNIDLDRIYTMLVSRAQNARRVELDLKSVVPISLTSLRHHPGGLEIKSLGAGSAFDLKEVPVSDQHIFRVLKLSFAARHSDRVRIQYHSPLRRAAVKSIKPGNTEFFLPLPFQKTAAIRIYPGDRAGLIDLRSAEVIEFSDHPEPGIQSLKEMTAEKVLPQVVGSDAALLENPVVRDIDDSKANRNTAISDLPADFDISLAQLNVIDTDGESNETATEDEGYLASLGYLNGKIDPDSESAATYPDLAVDPADPAAGPEVLSEYEILPDDNRMEEAGPELSGDPEALNNYGPVVDAGIEFSDGSEVLPDHNWTAKINLELSSAPEAQNSHLFIVSADIGLSHEPEALPYHQEAVEADPDFAESSEILPEAELLNSGEPDFSIDLDSLTAYERAVEVDSDFAGESDTLRGEIGDSAAAPELPTNSSMSRDHELTAIANDEFTKETEIPPVHVPVHENRNLNESPREQSDAAAADIPDNGRPPTAVAPAAETEVAVIASKPDNGETQAGETKSGNNVNSIVPAKVAKAAPNPPSINLTDFEDGRIFQRRNGRADIVVSGTIRGSADAVEARVVGADDFDEIVPWTVIDNSPGNGIFVGVLSGVPQGGWYHLQVRLPHTVSVSDKGSHKWGVGMLIACLGQSNMKEWFHTGESFTAHPLIRKNSDKGWTVPGSRGNGALAFGNRLARILGIPIGLIDYAVNGSGLRKEADWGTGYWEDRSPGSIYSRFIDGVSRIGGALEFVIWFQGEADAARKTVTEREYRTSLESYITNQVRADIDNSSAREHLPFLIIAMTRRPGGQNKSHQAIRNAQKLVADNVAECYLAATTLDLKNRGKQHMQPGAYTIMGRRAAQTVLYVLGQAHYYRGPTATTARQINDRRIDISIEHSGGTDFKPASGITGWQILVNEKTLPIAEVKRHDPSTISIILEDPLTESATVRYLYGAMPDARHPVVDNSALALPLEAYQARVK